LRSSDLGREDSGFLKSRNALPDKNNYGKLVLVMVLDDQNPLPCS
jgi:hypothetical protein